MNDLPLPPIASDSGPPQGEPVAIFLNGGSARREVFARFSEHLAQRGVRVVTFDYSFGEGHHYPVASLANRLREAELMLSEQTSAGDRIAVIGYSMGGHTAIELAARHRNVKVLVLVAPAAYGDNARELAFGESFRSAASMPGSWHNAAVFDQLLAVEATVLLMVPGVDHVVPPGVTTRYKNILASREGDSVLEFPEAAHQLMAWLNEHDEEYAEPADRIVNLLSS